MEKRGMARADQAITSQLIHHVQVLIGKLTHSNDVAEHAQSSEVELSLLDLRAATDERDQDRDGVAEGEADDTNTRKGIEGDRGSKVDETKDELDYHAEHHSIEGHVKLAVDDLP